MQSNGVNLLIFWTFWKYSTYDLNIPAYSIRKSRPHGAWDLKSCTSYTLPWMTTQRPPSVLWFSRSALRISWTSSNDFWLNLSKEWSDETDIYPQLARPTYQHQPNNPHKNTFTCKNKLGKYIILENSFNSRGCIPSHGSHLECEKNSNVTNRQRDLIITNMHMKLEANRII